MQVSMAETRAIFNIVGPNLTAPLTASQNSSILSAVNASLAQIPGITAIRIAEVQVCTCSVDVLTFSALQ